MGIFVSNLPVWAMLSEWEETELAENEHGSHCRHLCLLLPKMRIYSQNHRDPMALASGCKFLCVFQHCQTAFVAASGPNVPAN
jgi:hypothetical protein